MFLVTPRREAAPAIPWTYLTNWAACLICLLTAPALLSAATWYCSPTGSDSNPGTSSQPFRSVAAGVAAANPGDTIVLQDGTYPPDTTFGDGTLRGWLLWINKSGAPGAPITLTAEHKQKAILDCGNSYNGPQTGCKGYIYLGDPGPAYWVFQDLVFANTYDIALSMNSSTPAHDITVQGCLFENIGQHVTSTDVGMDAIYANQGHYNLLFNGNAFTGIGRLPGSTYMANDHALYLHSFNTTVINNVFYGYIGGWGVQTAIGFSGIIANNTFAFTSANTGGQVILWDVASGNVTVENNIFYNPPVGLAVNTCSFSAPSCSLNSNLVYNGIIGPIESCDGSATYCTPSDTLFANPEFVNPASNFHLELGSPAIDAGVTVPGVTTDYDGVARPQAGPFDIGAYALPHSVPVFRR